MNALTISNPTPIRARAGSVLTLEQIAKHAPSALAAEAHASRSDRYRFISSREVIEGLMANGFQPVEARQSRTRDRTKTEFTKHLIRFRKAEDSRVMKVNDVFPEVVLTNSHDGTSAYHLLAGLFRLICLNGMVCPDDFAQSLNVRHSGKNVVGEVVDAAFTVIKDADRAVEAKGSWESIRLNRDERMAFAESARVLRFGDAEGEVKTAIKPEQLLITRRAEDAGEDLWTTFNVVQENSIRGGIVAFGRDANNRRRKFTSREIKGIDQDLKLNKALWMLAENMAKLKGA